MTTPIDRLVRDALAAAPAAPVAEEAVACPRARRYSL